MNVDVSTTKMSSKGQVVIPEEIRNTLGLEPGVQFIVMGEGDAIIFKIINPIPKDEVKDFLKKTRLAAREYELSSSDIYKAIRSSRKANKKK